MQNQFSPLKVIINPPDILLGMPGDTLQLHAIITNQGNKDAKIFVDFDEAFQNLTLSNNSLQECLSLASQKSYEVSFEFQIPTNTPPGTYDYRLIVDAPEDYPEETPISFPLQIQVLIKEQTVRRGGDDPTFTIKPATNPNNPLIYKPGQPLQLAVTVNNRCQQVDRFRLTCPDLEETWFTIRYLKTGFEGVGLLFQSNGLELNDYSQGEILLDFHPPADAFAGTYPPTIRLHSQNRPDLILLDLVYITIPEVYSLDVELNTILGKVSRIAGKYELKLTNRGNTTRELIMSAKTQDEEQLCNYKFEPSQVKLLPTKSIDINLTAKPRNWWRRPWFGSGQVITFQTEIQDQKQLPLPNKFPQGTLVWKARPWWQFLLLFLLILGILGGTALIIWRILHPPQAKIDVFESTSPSYQEGNQISLNWQISNYQNLDKLKIFLTEETGIRKPLFSYEFKGKNPRELDKCQKQNNILNCNNIETGVRQPGKYSFELEASNNKGNKIPGKPPINVPINALPIPAIVNDTFKSDKTEYQKGEQVKLSWQISNLENLASLQIIEKQENGTSQIVDKFDFPQLQKLCKIDRALTCINTPVNLNKQPGKYTLVLQPVAKPIYQQDKVKSSNPITIDVTSKPFGIEFFGINGNTAISQQLEGGTTVELRWKVKGDPQDITVNLSINNADNEVQLEGSIQYPVSFVPQAVGIKVIDKYDKQKYMIRNITITPEPKSEPTPTASVDNIPQPAVAPTPPSQNVIQSPTDKGF
jgi:hypothetical protein